jgi:exodeoxyribonuclease V alpha subunit
MTTLSVLLQAGAMSPLSFQFAVFIARYAQQSNDSLLALTAALLSEANQQGDVCLDLSLHAGKLLFAREGVDAEAVSAPALAAWQQHLREADACVGEPGSSAPLILAGERLYLHRLWQDEQTVLHGISERLAVVADLDQQRLQAGLTRLYPAPASGNASTDTPDWQKLAAAMAVSRRFAVISGGPGTGKTTTVVKVLALLLEQNPAMRLCLAAPTGKAAARMVESIRMARQRLDLSPELMSLLPDEASTLHRLLGYQGLTGKQAYRHHRHNPLLIDCLVIDEASMIDLGLMKALLDATLADTRIILLGDRDQLAAVEAGNVLGDITGHGSALSYSPGMAELLAQLSATPQYSLPVAESPPPVADSIALLRTSHRFAGDSGIGQLARLVNAGDDSAVLELLHSPLVDIAWFAPAANAHNPLSGEALAWAIERFSDYLHCKDVAKALASFAGTRVLCAVHDGPLGACALNRLLGEKLRARSLLESGENFHGKPVMITVNDYELDLFNGDIGLLWRDSKGVLQACFTQLDGQIRRIPAGSLPEHTTAWALTVHKSQGSEFEQVLLVLPTDIRSPLLLRELLYTGITRARSRLLLHADGKALAVACRTPVRRSSGLAQLLGW